MHNIPDPHRSVHCAHIRCVCFLTDNILRPILNFNDIHNMSETEDSSWMVPVKGSESDFSIIDKNNLCPNKIGSHQVATVTMIPSILKSTPKLRHALHLRYS